MTEITDNISWMAQQLIQSSPAVSPGLVEISHHNTGNRSISGELGRAKRWLLTLDTMEYRLECWRADSVSLVHFVFCTSCLLIFFFFLY